MSKFSCQAISSHSSGASIPRLKSGMEELRTDVLSDKGNTSSLLKNDQPLHILLQQLKRCHGSISSSNFNNKQRAQILGEYNLMLAVLTVLVKIVQRSLQASFEVMLKAT